MLEDFQKGEESTYEQHIATGLDLLYGVGTRQPPNNAILIFSGYPFIPSQNGRRLSCSRFPLQRRNEEGPDTADGGAFIPCKAASKIDFSRNISYLSDAAKYLGTFSLFTKPKAIHQHQGRPTVEAPQQLCLHAATPC